MTTKKTVPPKSITMKHNLMTLGSAIQTPKGSQQETISLQLDTLEA